MCCQQTHPCTIKKIVLNSFICTLNLVTSYCILVVDIGVIKVFRYDYLLSNRSLSIKTVHSILFFVILSSSWYKQMVILKRKKKCMQACRAMIVQRKKGGSQSRDTNPWSSLYATYPYELLIAIPFTNDEGKRHDKTRKTKKLKMCGKHGRKPVLHLCSPPG